jgi:hydrogenase nickel incorporation protein HypA/HybF
MHEFSLATEVIRLAEKEAESHQSNEIQEITIEIGFLSGVEADAFESALGLLVAGTIMNRAKVNIIKTPGKGRCNACELVFEMNHRLDTCPECKSFPSEISGGEEFRVVSLVVE